MLQILYHLNRSSGSGVRYPAEKSCNPLISEIDLSVFVSYGEGKQLFKKQRTNNEACEGENCHSTGCDKDRIIQNPV